MGGSTLSLAAGLAARPDGRPQAIHTYDQFILVPDMVGYADDELARLATGDSLLPIFERNLAEFRETITLHAGDVCEEKWAGEPIDILFLDILKSWDINAHVTHEFFPALVPETSVVVQQDLVHWRYPWCAIVMEHLSDYFEYIGWTWYASSVWRCISAPPAGLLEIDWRSDIGLEPGLELLRRAAERHTGWAVPNLELARATLMHEFGEDQAARDEISRVEAAYGTVVPYIEQAYQTLRDLI